MARSILSIGDEVRWRGGAYRIMEILGGNTVVIAVLNPVDGQSRQLIVTRDNVHLVVPKGKQR